MIPIRDFNPSRRFPYVTVAIIVVNFVVFLLVEPSVNGNPGDQQAFFYCNAEISYEVSHHTNLANGGADAIQAIEKDYGADPVTAAQLEQAIATRCPRKSWLWSIVEAMFLHAGWLHILGNMLYLWIFGDNVEDRLGRVGYLAFYLLGGFAATGLQLAIQPSSTVPNLGASGAIAAVLGAYLLFYPNARVLVVGFPFFLFPLRAMWVLGFWFFIQLVYGAGSLGTQVNGGVAYWAHVGGIRVRRRRRVAHAASDTAPAALYALVVSGALTLDGGHGIRCRGSTRSAAARASRVLARQWGAS